MHSAIRFASLFLLSVAGALCAPVWAQAYPTRVVTMIVPYPPGGATDVIGRVVAQKLSDALGQQVVVENKGGAGGNLGARAAAVAKNDGYTLLMGAVTAHSIAQTLQADTAGYNLERDFAPISMLGNVPLILVVNPAVPAKNLAEFIALAKAKPGDLTVSSAGNGTTQHLGSELFKLMTKTEMVHVPYKGSGPSITDLIGGQVKATFETGPAALGQVKGGKLRALAVASRTRSELLPDVPTAAEAGLEGFEVSATYGLLAPAGTPKEIVDRLNAEAKKILAMPDVKAKLLEQGVDPMYTTPEQTRAHIRGEIDKWARVIKAANVKAD
jgi:tripartite-type tricarboxylate transporter receptor subunit TctC